MGRDICIRYSQKRALKLLKFVHRHRVHEPIDWFMIDCISRGDIVAYKAIPHIFVQSSRHFKNTTAKDDEGGNNPVEVSSTASDYIVEQHQLFIDAWKEQCLHERSDPSFQVFSTTNAEESKYNDFVLDFMKPYLEPGPGADRFVTVAPHFHVQLGLTLPRSVDEENFREFHRCSSLCWFLIGNENFDDVHNISKSFQCSPFLNRLEQEFLTNVPMGRTVLVGQMYNRNGEAVGMHVKIRIKVVYEVQPVFVLPESGSMTSTTTDIQIALTVADGVEFLKEQKYAKLCLSIDGEFFVRENFITCAPLNDFSTPLTLSQIDYGWTRARAWIIGVDGEQIGVVGYQHFFVAAETTANDNERRLWDMTVQSGKVLNVCKGLAQTSPTECRAQADSNEALHDLTLLVLVNRGKRSFENALKSWDKHNLFHMVSKTIVFFQNLGIGQTSRRIQGSKSYFTKKPLLDLAIEAWKSRA